MEDDAKVYAVYTPDHVGGIVVGNWWAILRVYPGVRAKGFVPSTPTTADWEAAVAAGRRWLWDKKHRAYSCRALRYVRGR